MLDLSNVFFIATANTLDTFHKAPWQGSWPFGPSLLLLADLHQDKMLDMIIAKIIMDLTLK
jgi:hypothetical protein